MDNSEMIRRGLYHKFGCVVNWPEDEVEVEVEIDPANIDLQREYGVNDDEMRLAQDMLNTFDHDKDGNLSFQELKDVIIHFVPKDWTDNQFRVNYETRTINNGGVYNLELML